MGLSGGGGNRIQTTLRERSQNRILLNSTPRSSTESTPTPSTERFCVARQLDGAVPQPLQKLAFCQRLNEGASELAVKRAVAARGSGWEGGCPPPSSTLSSSACRSSSSKRSKREYEKKAQRHPDDRGKSDEASSGAPEFALPSDREWSIAVGLGKEDQPAADLSPEELGQREIDHYPWGGSFPPRSDDRAGNYADTAWHESFPDRPWIAGYTDGCATTAPVMSFKPNALGLYDTVGNVEEWCLDLHSPSHPDRRVTRGFSYHLASPLMMRSNRRGYGIETIPSNGTGFRIVLDTSTDPPGPLQP